MTFIPLFHKFPSLVRRRRLGRVGFFMIMFAVLFVAMHFDADFVRDFMPAFVLYHMRVIHEIIFAVLLVLLGILYNKSYDAYLSHLNNEMRLKMFIKHTPAAVAMLDNEMRYLATSDRWLEDYKIDDRDIIGRSHYDVFPTIREMPKWLDDHRRCLSGETIKRIEDSFIGREGQTEWLSYEIIPWFDVKEKIGGLIFFTELVTERMNIMQKLQESEARFERAMNGSNDGIFDWNLVTDEMYTSPHFKTLLGYDEIEMPNTPKAWKKLLHPDDYCRVSTMVEKHLEKKEPYHVEYRLRKKSGDYLWVLARGQAEWDEAGRPKYFAGTMSDISERKRLEDLKSEFVYVVTHELRTPLATLRGALDMLPHLLGELPVKAGKSLDLAIQGCDRLNLLVNDLLEAGRAETEQIAYDMKPVRIKKLLDHAIELDCHYGMKYGVTYCLDENVPDVEINVDENRFLQIMANLLSNAAKFSPNGGRVDIGVALRDDNVIVTVRDYGSGITDEFKPRIFQKFARNHSDVSGTGLGLNITKTMVEKMNGTIRFESQEGRGTVFIVSFPMV